MNMGVWSSGMPVQRFIEVIEHVARDGERLKADAFERQVLVTAPELAFVQVIIQWPILVKVLQVQGYLI